MNEQILILRTTLEGLRAMACIEACAGSKTWRNAVETIDRILEETNPGYTEAEIEELMKQEPLQKECPNCGRPLEDCAGNCVFNDLPNKGFTEFSDYETSFAKVKRIMQENRED